MHAKLTGHVIVRHCIVTMTLNSLASLDQKTTAWIDFGIAQGHVYSKQSALRLETIANVTQPSVSTVSKCGINYLKFSGRGGPYGRYGTEKSYW